MHPGLCVVDKLIVLSSALTVRCHQARSLTMAWMSHGKDNAHLVSLLKENGVIESDRVQRVMSLVDRGHYCAHDPYSDRPQPIGFGVTISAPHMHAYALENLRHHLREGASVLDVGSGSGYLTVCMALMVGATGHVTGVEHIDELVRRSRDNVARDQPQLAGSPQRLSLLAGDGRLGYQPHAPYDVIHVGAAAPQLPQQLVDQLKPGGRLLLPVGVQGGSQHMQQVDKSPDGNITRTKLMSVVYVPLTDRAQQCPSQCVSS